VRTGLRIYPNNNKEKMLKQVQHDSLRVRVIKSRLVFPQGRQNRAGPG
jgi:hypothetical protein